MSRAGTILRIDLTERKIEKEPTSSYVRDYIGGGGIGAKIIWDGVPPEVKAYDPRNMLTFNMGPLTGTLLGNKCEVMSKSPLRPNNILVTAGMGGQFGSELKFAGYDNLVIQGKADGPVYLFINNDNVEIRDAKHLWGLDVYETQTRIKEELKDPDVKIACIGLAGENLVAFALILHDIQNTASQGGLGAVMGSKNLKAVAVRGTKGLKVADPEAFKALWKEYWEYYTEGRGSLFVRMMSREGTAGQTDYWPWRNYDQWGYDGRHITPPVNKEDTLREFLKKYMVGSIGCAFCPVQCQQNISMPGIDNGGITCTGYMSFRFYLKNFDTKLYWKAIAKAQRYGITHLEVGAILGWLMLLFEKGIITAADTDGVPMEWGSEEAVMTFIEKVAKREGFSNLFADGLIRAAKAIGKGTSNLIAPRGTESGRPWVGGVGIFALPIKWVNQILWYEPYAFDIDPTIPLYAEELGISTEESEKLIEEWTSDFAEKTTGDRDAWRPDSVNVAKFIRACENAVSVCDISGHCDWLSDKFAHFGCGKGVEETAKWLSAATGTSYTTEILLDAIQRKRLLEMSYAILCRRMIREEVPPLRPPEPWRGGYFKGIKVDLAKASQVAGQYYELRGCDPETGIPTREELERLGLKDVADKLAAPVDKPRARKPKE